MPYIGVCPPATTRMPGSSPGEQAVGVGGLGSAGRGAGGAGEGLRQRGGVLPGGGRWCLPGGAPLLRGLALAGAGLQLSHQHVKVLVTAPHLAPLVNRVDLRRVTAGRGVREHPLGHLPPKTPRGRGDGAPPHLAGQQAGADLLGVGVQHAALPVQVALLACGQRKAAGCWGGRGGQGVQGRAVLCGAQVLCPLHVWPQLRFPPVWMVG